MGVDVIKLKNEGEKPRVLPQDLARPAFLLQNLPASPMSVWLMSMLPGASLFPWWTYSAHIDADIYRLQKERGVSGPQALFDFLFLNLLNKASGGGLYAVFSGSVKTEVWGRLKEEDRHMILRGQGCIYRLDGGFTGKLHINWVPLWQPQSIVKDPPFDNLWRVFNENRIDDDVNTITFFSLPNAYDLPKVLPLFVKKDEPKRSEKLAEVVDWFGLYSSPIEPSFGSSAVVYTRQEAILARFQHLQADFQNILTRCQNALLVDPNPQTVLKFLTHPSFR